MKAKISNQPPINISPRVLLTVIDKARVAAPVIAALVKGLESLGYGVMCAYVSKQDGGEPIHIISLDHLHKHDIQRIEEMIAGQSENDKVPSLIV